MFGLIVKLGAYFKAIAGSPRFISGAKRRAGSGARINHHVALVRKYLNQARQHIDWLLRRVDFRHILSVPAPFKPVEHHFSVVVEKNQVEWLRKEKATKGKTEPLSKKKPHPLLEQIMDSTTDKNEGEEDIVFPEPESFINCK